MKILASETVTRMRRESGEKYGADDAARRIPYLSQVRAISVTHINRVQIGIDNRTTIGGPVRIKRDLGPHHLRIASQNRNRPDGTSPGLVIQIRFQRQHFRCIRRNVQHSHSGDRNSQRGHRATIHRHFHGMTLTLKIEPGSIRDQRPVF